MARDAKSSEISCSSLCEKFKPEKTLSSSSLVRLFDLDDFPDVSQCLSFITASSDASTSVCGPILRDEFGDDPPDILVMTVEMILRTVSLLGGRINDSKDEENGMGEPDLIEVLLIYIQGFRATKLICPRLGR